MSDTGKLSYRQLAHEQLRQVMLDAAFELLVESGWSRLRMAHVAAHAGVSRQTLYNEFPDKQALGEALAGREAERFVTGLVHRLESPAPHAGEALARVVLYGLREVHDNVLVKAIVTSSSTDLQSLANTEEVLVKARSAIAKTLQRAWPDAEPADVRRAAEWIARLTISYVVLPLQPAETTAHELANMVARYLDSSPAAEH